MLALCTCCESSRTSFCVRWGSAFPRYGIASSFTLDLLYRWHGVWLRAASRKGWWHVPLMRRLVHCTPGKQALESHTTLH